MDKEKQKQILSLCHEMKLKALEMALGTGSIGCHIGGGFSLMEIMATLYSLANISIGDVNRDRIIMSKGHGVLALYTALWKYQFITDNDLSTFDKNGTNLYGHAHRCLDKGIEFSGGSLGLGLSYAVGVAMACKKKNICNHIYVIVGDGECDEGIVWESLMSIANYKLNNMTIIVDRNRYQLDGPTDEVLDQLDLEDKFKSFGFDIETIDGHSINDLYNALTKQNDIRPKAIIANTIKANGISFLINNKLSHQCAITPKKYQQAIEDINKMYGEI